MNKQIEEMALAMAGEVRTCLVECECKDCGWHKTDNCPLMDYTKRLAEKGYRKQEWISVDERLPSHLQEVLVCDSFGNMVTAIFLSFDNGGCDWCSAVRIVHKITHWMPLPETPKKYESEGADDE